MSKQNQVVILGKEKTHKNGSLHMMFKSYRLSSYAMAYQQTYVAKRGRNHSDQSK